MLSRSPVVLEARARLYLYRNLSFFHPLKCGKGMGKGKESKTAGLAMIAVAAVALAAAYFGAFGSVGAWFRRYDTWQLGLLLVTVILLAVVFGLYHRHETSRLRRETVERQREVAGLKREAADLRQTRETLHRNEARYGGLVAGLPVALFAVDGAGVFTLSEGRGLDALGLGPKAVVGRSIFEMHRDAPQIVENLRLALAGKAFDATLEVGGLAFETRYSPLLENGEFAGVLGVATDVTERKEAEDRLRAAEARYRTLVEQVPAITYIEELSEQGKQLTYISPQYEATLGYSPESGISHPEHWLEIVHPDDRERIRAEDIRTDETLEPFRVEYRVFARDGRVVWIRDEAVVVRDEEGRPSFWQGVMFDVTERKQAEETLEESQRRLSTLLSNAPAYLYRCRNEPGWPNEFVSDYAFELTGHTPEELTDGSVMFGDLIVAEDEDKVWKEVQAGLAEGGRFELRYSIRRKDGALRHVEERGQGVYGEDGRVEAIEGVVYDVTERVRAEEGLRAAEERYRNLVERIPAVTFVDRAEGSEKPLYVSPQIEQLLGYTPEEWMAGRLWRERLHPEDRERILVSDERFEATGGRVDQEYRLVAKDGSVVWVREETVLVRGEGGDPLYVQGILTDVTERKEAEERLRTSEAELRALFEAMTDLIFEIDDEGRYLKIAPTNPSLLYRSPGEMLGKRLHEIMPKEQADMFRDHIRRALKTRQKVDTEYSLTIGDEEVWFAGTIAPMAEDRVVFIARDITERRRTEEARRESEERYRLVAQATNEVIWDNDLTTNARVWDGATEAVFGYPPEEMGTAAEWWEQRIHPEDRERVLANTQAALESGGETWTEEYRFKRSDGTYARVVDSTYLVRDAEGRPVRMLGSIMDVTERRRAEEALRKSQAGLAEAQRMAHLGNWEWDVRTGELYWSDETFRIYGHEPQSFVPTFEKLLEVVHPDDRKMLGRELEEALDEDRPYDFEHRIVKPNGEVRVVHRQAEVMRDESGEPVRMVGTVHDVTERKALEEQLQHQAMHDPLTGLPNRVLFTDRLRQALTRARRRDGEVAVLFMDLDNFKVVNDSLGHKAGDRLLVAASKRISTLLRPEDTVARIGGDEFVFLLEDTGAQGALRVAERILKRLQEPFSLGRRRLVVTASIGVATGGGDGKYAADLLRDADLAMYRAKRAGKARHAVFEEAMNAEALDRLEMEQDLRRAIERGELRLHYQPQILLDADLQRSLRAMGSRAIVSSRTPQEPRITGAEALVRWEHPERGLLLPGQFVPLAEETGLIVPMGEKILEEACRQAKDWQERFATDPPLAVYVNLSARQFREPDLTKTVFRILRETELDPACLHLEITETTAMSDAPATISTLEELKALGVRLVIDDFGTGYSSLSYLQRFPVDYIKIDRSFVGGLDTDPAATALVHGMIDLAHTLDIEVIAEGVERIDQLERLCAMRCDLAQGYYFSEPLPGEAMDALLSEVRSDK